MGNTPTVMEAVRLSEGYLQKHGVDSPRLSAEHLLARALRCSRLDLYLRFEEGLGEDTLERYRADLKRRAAHYPLQYITGETEFYSLPFRVSEGVFIPRPETEILVEAAEKGLGLPENTRFLELGSGSGIIPATLAKRNPGWTGVTFDIDADAARLAMKNIETLGVGDRVSVFVGDRFDAISRSASFDLLVSNPPYIPSGEIAGLQRQVSQWEPGRALDGGERGLDFYPELARAGRRLLSRGGAIALEIGALQGEEVSDMLGAEGFRDIRVIKDYNGSDRVVTALSPGSGDGES
ncbi:MAG TPA: peptide chain release factor N(5)-glutamine methyltransferase [Candidatus Krumholzibacterium sp.]|nr:peptide chain release factor N(5)-glutamine methyltransferase [Candidatus Krumholzibacterium sp.]